VKPPECQTLPRFALNGRQRRAKAHSIHRICFPAIPSPVDDVLAWQCAAWRKMSVTIGDTTWLAFSGEFPMGMVPGDVFTSGGQTFALLSGSQTAGIGVVQAVPEPAAIALWSLIGLGVAGFGYSRARRKR
jgi:hypothetical protein